jgi:hypothetical protein
MTTPSLRIFGLDMFSDELSTPTTGTSVPEAPTDLDFVAARGVPQAPRMVKMRTGDVLRVLVQGGRRHPQWLDDFAEDPIEVTEDFYEVLLAYDRMRRAA